MPFVILPTNSASGGYDITNSLRFNSGSSDYLSRTPASSGNRRTWTYSTWIKRSTITTLQEILNVTSGSYSNTEWVRFLFEDVDTIGMQLDVGVNNVKTVAVFRDVSAWYHLLFAVDTTQATNTNRLKLYVNGTQITSFTGTYVAQNSDTGVNHTLAHNIGRNNVGTNAYLNGYVAETYLIDGQALTPTSFGETDEDSGIWKPKAFSGTYGTNGFYLQFKNSASLGTDTSGNGNNFTVNNLTSIDQTTDTPTNNFATWNGVADNLDVTLSNGNLSVVHGTALERRPVICNFGLSTGKWYAEFKPTSDSGSGNLEYGIVTQPSPSAIGRYMNQNPLNSGSVSYINDGSIQVDGSATTGLSTYTTNDIIGIAVDKTNSLIYFYKNGTLVNSGGTSFSGIVQGDGNFYYCNADRSGASTYNSDANFGNPPYSANSYTDGAGYGNFSYAVPSGYYALNTKNLATFG
jgi:hypothetical protein